MSDVRANIAADLQGRMAPEKLEVLLDAVLAIEKNARGWCPDCGKAVMVKIPDAKAVTDSLINLANQAWGRPDVAVGADDEQILFERVVYLGDEAA